MIHYAHRAISRTVKEVLFKQALSSLTLQAKNLRNCLLFLIRNVALSFDLDEGTLKPDLTENHLRSLDLINEAVAAVNLMRTAKAEAATAKSGKIVEPKLLKVFGQGAVPFSVLDSTLLDTAMRLLVDDKGKVPCKELPAVMAQQVRKQVCEDFQSFFKANKAFAKNPKDFTGKPKMPGYLGKDDLATIHIPYAALGRHLASIEDKELFTDFGKTTLLSKEAKEAYAKFDVAALIFDTVKALPQGARPLELRIAPKGKKVKLEVVVEFPIVIPDDSTMAAFYASLPLDCTPKEQAGLLPIFLNGLKKLPRIAAGDVGLNNLIGIAYSTGAKGAVISNARMEAAVSGLNEKLDALKSRLTPDSAKQLQAAQEKGAKPSKADRFTLARELKVVYSNPEYVRLLEHRNNLTLSFMHKISRNIVDLLVKNRIEVLVIGLNKGWKQEADMGRTQNRRFLDTAHTKLIELLKYKAEAKGILVTTTEESHTSKTSFAANEKLRAKKAPAKPTTTEGEPRPGPQGIRGTGILRHEFTTLSLTGAWRVIHADINGAFNIIRKAFKKFRFHAGLSPKYVRYWLSPKQGLTPFQA